MGSRLLAFIPDPVPDLDTEPSTAPAVPTDPPPPPASKASLATLRFLREPRGKGSSGRLLPFGVRGSLCCMRVGMRGIGVPGPPGWEKGGKGGGREGTVLFSSSFPPAAFNEISDLALRTIG